jgi:ribosomal-protein-alanine N-acetyltransferase
LITSAADNLLIKPFFETDACDFFELTQDDGFNAFPINIYRQENVGAASEWIRSVKGKYGVWEKSTGKLIGMGGLTPWVWDGEQLVDITYRLRTSAWGKGLGLELATSLVRYGFHVMKLPEISATIMPENIPSKKIAEKLGFKFSKHILLKGVPTDLYRLSQETSQ